MSSRRNKIIAAVVVVLLLAIFLPPNINGTRFRDRRVRPALQAALGRAVKIGAVKYRLFPRPGFDLYDFQVMDDPAFGAEPVLMCGKVTADLRLTSLWKGRLEFANLKLTDDWAPPSLNLVYANEHWNVESLLVRAEQVPSAPTGRRRAEQRPRFPYIEATGGRINFKKGPEKKSYTLSNTDFAFWLESEDLWHFRLEGRPVRTDMTLNGTGTVKVEGDLRRSANLQDMPVKLSVSWEKTQLGQFSKLVSGQDRGWRGDLEGNANIAGTLSNLHLTGAVDLSHFHRYDVDRDGMARLRTRCLGDFIRGVLDLKCDAPLDPGGLLVRARWSTAAPLDYDLSLVADHVPMATIAKLARHARASLPNDLTATGDLNAAFGFHSRNGEREWHGAGMSSPFLLQSSLADKPFPVSSIRFHIGVMPALTPPKKGRQSKQADAAPVSTVNSHPPFTVDAFSVQLGSSTVLEIQGNLDGAGYQFSGRGMVPLERLLVLGRLAGLAGESSNFTASAVVDLNLAGHWADNTPAPVLGTARIQNLTAWIPGIKNRLVLAQAEAQLTDASLVLSHMEGQFEQSPVAFNGRVERPWHCQSPACVFDFDLHAGKLAIADLSALLNDKGWSLPFFSSSGKLPDFRARGSFSADELKFALLPFEKFTAHLELKDNKLELSGVSARLGGGSFEGDWQADWSGSQPRFESKGSLNGVDLDRLNASDENHDFDLMNSWVTGKTQGKYALHFEGKSAEEMLASAAGHADFTVSAGDSRALLLQPAKPLRFQTLQGAADLGKQVLTVLPSKIRTENRIYEISGKVALAERKADLKVSSGGSRWEVTGALDSPRISPPSLTAQTTSAQRQ